MRFITISVVLFLVGVVVLNLYRLLAFERTNEDPKDLRQIFIAGKLFDKQLDPYNDSLLKQEWDGTLRAEGLTYSLAPGAPENYMVYPPHVAAMASIASGSSWRIAGNLMWALCAASVLVILLMMVKEAQPSTHRWFQAGWFAGFKGLAPALMLGQPALPVIALLFPAATGRIRNDMVLAALLAFSCVKPSLALPLLVWFLVEKRYRLLFFTALVLLVLQVPVLLNYGKDTFGIYLGWLQNLKLQNAVAFLPGHEFFSSNLTSLSTAVHQLTGFELYRFDLFFLFGSFLLLGIARRRQQVDSQTTLFLLLLLSFLFSYHLYYDLLILVLCLPYLIKRQYRFSAALLVLVCLPLNFLLGYFTINSMLLLMLFIVFLMESRRGSRLSGSEQ